MNQHTESPIAVGESRMELPAEATASTPESRKVTVAYEEVTLTEEAALIVENARREMAQQTEREARRMPVGDPAKFRRS
jgi:hypothetical protein